MALGDGLEFGPELGCFKEVQGACGVGACFGGCVGSKEEEEFDEEEIWVVVFAALEEGECMGTEVGFVLVLGSVNVGEKGFNGCVVFGGQNLERFSLQFQWEL